MLLMQVQQQKQQPWNDENYSIRPSFSGFYFFEVSINYEALSGAFNLEARWKWVNEAFF